MKKILFLFLILGLISGCNDQSQLKSDLSNQSKTITLKDKTNDIIVNIAGADDLTGVSLKTTKLNAEDINVDADMNMLLGVNIEAESANLAEFNINNLMIKLPSNPEQKDLILYSISNNQLENEYEIEVVNKDGNYYVSFETSKLGSYVLLEKIEPEESKDDSAENELENKKTENTKPENNKTSTENNKVNKPTTSEQNKVNTKEEVTETKTINLVGAWKVTTGQTIMVYNKDYSGKLINVSESLSDPVFVPFVWSLKGTSLYTKYEKNGYGSATSNIKIIDENTFELKNGVVYKRYYGELPKEKVYYTGSFTLDVEIKGLPENLQILSQTAATYKFRTEDKALYDKTVNDKFTAYVNADECPVGDCQLFLQLTHFPSGVEFLGGTSTITLKLAEK